MMLPRSPSAARVLGRHRHGAIVHRDVGIDEHDSRTAGGTPEEQILRQRLERILVIARRMVEDARGQASDAAVRDSRGAGEDRRGRRGQLASAVPDGGPLFEQFEAECQYASPRIVMCEDRAEEVFLEVLLLPGLVATLRATPVSLLAVVFEVRQSTED
jgi:hypothetical protein